MEPHELIWKSVTAILHRIFVSNLEHFFQNLRYMEPSVQIFRFETLIVQIFYLRK